MVMPGDNTAMTVELIKPIAMDEGLRFAIREGGRTVGSGRVTKILKNPPRGQGVKPVTYSSEVSQPVAAARAGDRSAFDELVRATYTDTYTLAYRLTGNEEDARDVVQESYLRAYRGLRRFRGDAQFTTWLYRITANCASTHVTRRRRHRHDALDDDAPLVDDPARGRPAGSADAVRDRATSSKPLCAELPPRLRAVVVLRDVYDLPHEAIAAELGISDAAAKVRLHRARRRLREQVFPRRDAGTVEEVSACGVTRLTELLAEAADGQPASGRAARAPRRALPAVPGRARPVPQAAPEPPPAATGCSHRPPGLLTEMLAALDEAGASAAPAAALPTGRDARGHGGGDRRAAAASVLVLRTSRRRLAAADCRAPIRAGSPLLRLGVPTRPRAVAQLEEHRSPKPAVGGSSPSCPALPTSTRGAAMAMNRETKRMMQRQGQIGPTARPCATKRAAPAARPRSEERTSPGQFLREVRGELRKVAWPTKSEVINYSIIVLIAVVLPHRVHRGARLVLRLSDPSAVQPMSDRDEQTTSPPNTRGPGARRSTRTSAPCSSTTSCSTRRPARTRTATTRRVVESPYDRPGHWYVVHTQSGYEKKVKQNLEARTQSMNAEDKIFEVVIPMEDVVEFKNGRKVVVQKKVFPGYLLVRCDMDDDSWYVIRNTPGVTGSWARARSRRRCPAATSSRSSRSRSRGTSPPSARSPVSNTRWASRLRTRSRPGSWAVFPVGWLDPRILTRPLDS